MNLVLGPLLTLIIFDITKSRSKLIGDVIAIAMLQFSALAWGVSTIHDQRPVAVVFWENSFITVPALALSEQGLTTDDLAEFGDMTPTLIYAEKSQSHEGLQLLLKRVRQQNLPPHHMLEL